MRDTTIHAWMTLVAESVKDQRDYLTQLDAAIGDGDHGVNMDRGFDAVGKALAAQGDDASARQAPDQWPARRWCRRSAERAVPSGGPRSAAPGRALGDREELDGPGPGRRTRRRRWTASSSSAPPSRATRRWSTRSVPRSTRSRAALDAGEPLDRGARRRRAEAAEDGARATVPLQARKGRASYLGERSIGHQDPGATSAALDHAPRSSGRSSGRADERAESCAALPASPGLAAGRARMLSPPSGTSARAPVPEPELAATRPSGPGARCGRGRSELRAASPPRLRASGRDQEARDRGDGRADGRRPRARGGGGAPPIRERRVGRRRGAARGGRGARARHRGAARPDARGARRRRALARPPGGADRRTAAATSRAATGRRSSSSRRTSGRPTWPSMASGPRGIALVGWRRHRARRDRGPLARHADDRAGGRGAARAWPTARAIVVDGAEGEVVVDASAERLRAGGVGLARTRAGARAGAARTGELPAVTADGRRVRVLVERRHERPRSRPGSTAGAEGAGLIRTELAFLDATGWPSRGAARSRCSTPLLRGVCRRHRHGAGARLRRRQGAAVPARRAAPRDRAAAARTRARSARSCAAIARAGRPAASCACSSRSSAAAEDVRLTQGDARRATRRALSLGAMIELPEAAAAAREIAARVRLPQRRHERPDARDPRHRPVRARRGAGARPARAAQHRRAPPRPPAEAGIPLEVCGEAASDPLDRAAAGGARRRRAERGGGARGHGARLDPRRSTTRARASSRARRWPPPTRAAVGAAGSAPLAPDQLRVATRSRMAVRAASASSPVAVRRSSVPAFAPRASTERRLLASASRSPERDLDATRRSPSRPGRSRPPAARGGPRRAGSAHERPPQSLPAPRASSADRATSSSGMSADAVTAAAIAPSTIGASTSRTCPLPCRSST